MKTKTINVTMRTSYAGPMGNGNPGDVLALPELEAKGLIDAGYAFVAGQEKYDRSTPAPPSEAAVIGAPEAAAAAAPETATPPTPAAAATVKRKK